MEFKFSIKGAVKEAWALFKKHIGFFISLSAISVVLNFLGNGKRTPFPVIVILTVASFIWSIVIMKFSLAAADNKEELFSFSKIQSILPSFNQILGMIGVGLLVGLFVICGLVLLIIPGLWVAFRLSVANFVYLDKGDGIRKAVRTSWNMTKGHVFWTAVLVGLSSALLYIVGLILLGVGILVTYPIAMILMAKFYRALSNHYNNSQTIVPQPVEISPNPAQ